MTAVKYGEELVIRVLIMDLSLSSSPSQDMVARLHILRVREPPSLSTVWGREFTIRAILFFWISSLSYIELQLLTAHIFQEL